MRRPRLAIYAVIAVAAAAVPAASGSAALTAPNGLQAFELRLGDSKTATPSFSRTPSLAWNPVRGAVRYQFELSATKRFRAGNAVIWSGKRAITPATAVPIALPWLNGHPLYWRVRAFGGDAVSRVEHAGQVPGSGRQGPEPPRQRAGLRQVVSGRGSERLSGLVPEPRHGRLDDVHGRRSPRLRPRRGSRQGRLARACAAPAARLRQAGAACSLLRPLEQDVRARACRPAPRRD